MSLAHSLAWRIATLVVVCQLGGCVAVPPYKRAFLVRRPMLVDPNPTSTSLEQHVYEYREGSAGAQGTVGGGCGCN